MREFKLWFAYYDSFFLNIAPKLSERFYEDHLIPQATWPSSVCSNLAQTFQLMENFIKDPQSWIQSQCKMQELENVESEVNQLLHFMQIEKSYAYMFWEKDNRRVEASMVHFYTFLQLLIKAIIPYPTMTLFQCRTANKLCVEITKLQKFMNDILKCVNPIAKFLSGPKFSEQSKLIANFFENWIFFMKKLPTIKRNKLNHIHNLSKFINLTNPIQICTSEQKIEQPQGIRKKSNTVGNRANLKSYQLPQQTNQNLNNSTNISKKKKKRSSSCIEFYVNLSIEGANNNRKQKKSKLFKFPQGILKYALQEQVRKKANSLQSLAPLQNKVQSFTKNRTLTATNDTGQLSRINTDDRLFVKRKRNKAKSTCQTKNHSNSMSKRPSANTLNNQKFQFKRQKTKFYQEECERDSEKMSVRSSKQSTIRRRQLSIHTISPVQNEQRPKMIPKQHLFYQGKANYSIEGGSLVHSRWDLVRNYVKQLNTMRKLNKILCM